MVDESPQFEPTEPPLEPPSLLTKKKQKDSIPRQPGSTGATRGRPNKHNQRKEKLLTILATTGTAVMMFEAFDGTVILQHAEDVAEATATLADEVPAVAKALDAMSTGGAYGAFFLALASMLIPILAHHNIVPEFLAGAFIPAEQPGAQAA